MYKKITATILIITIWNLTLFTGKLTAQEIIPNCADGPNSTELTLFGDSRAFNLATGFDDVNRHAIQFKDGEPSGTINGAESPVINELLIADGEITHGFSQNLGWPGATATDGEKLDAPVELLLGLAIWSIIGAFSSLGPLGMLLAWVAGYFILQDLQSNFNKVYESINKAPDNQNWNRRLAHCILNEGLPYRTSNNVVISIGGNDMLNFYNYMEGFEGIYFFFRVITQPKRYLESLLYGKKFIDKWSKEIFWFWQFEIKEDAIVNETKSLIQYHLDNLVIPPYTKPNQVMLVSVAPTIAMGGLDYLWNGNLEDWIRLTFYLRRLRDKYQWNILPHFTNAQYAGRVHFLDMYDRFLHNILWEGMTYYWPGDGIHFTGAGNAEFGRMIAAKAIEVGWFRKNPAVSDRLIDEMASGYVVNASSYCSVSNPQNCTDSTTCGVFGHQWCGSYCQAGSCPAPAPPGPNPAELLFLCFFLGICG